MSFETARDHLAGFGLADRIKVDKVPTATVMQAAEALGVAPALIAKTLAFKGVEPGSAILIVAAGDARVHNGSFKAKFGIKASMLDPESTIELTGHAIGGVCPFANPEGTPVYLDESLRRFEVVYPACGSSDSSVRLTLGELETASLAKGWVNVTKIPEAG